MPSKIPPSGHPDNPNDENRSELLQFLTTLVQFCVVLALTIGMVVFVTLQPSPESAAVVVASCLQLWVQLKNRQPVE